MISSKVNHRLMLMHVCYEVDVGVWSVSNLLLDFMIDFDGPSFLCIMFQYCLLFLKPSRTTTPISLFHISVVMIPASIIKQCKKVNDIILANN